MTFLNLYLDFTIINTKNTLYGPFLLKLLVTVKIMYKKKFLKCAINVVRAVQVNISNAYIEILVEELKV